MSGMGSRCKRYYLLQTVLVIFTHRNVKPVANKKKRKENLTNLSKEIKQYYHILQHK